MSPGIKLGGRYRLDERIATGGMGDVWRATDEVLGRVVAAKVLLPSLLNEPGFVERFRAEARVVATLSHPNIVRVYDYGENPMPGGGQVAYLIMEFIEGEALTARLQQRGRLTADETLPLMAQAAEALNAAHEHGIIHRDVKPGNLLIAKGDRVMLTDFGIARSGLTGGLTQAGSVLGTAAYVSPEQASGHQVTGQSDVYSLGIVTYQCLAGQRPYDSDNPVELAMRHVNSTPPPLPNDVPEPARRFVEQALAKDLAVRFATGQVMADAARAAAGGQVGVPPATVGGGGYTPGGVAMGAAASPPGRGMDDKTAVGMAFDPSTPVPVQKRNKMMMIVAGAVLLVVVLAAGAWAVWGGDGADAKVNGEGTSESTAEDTEQDEFAIDVAQYINMDPLIVQQQLEKAGYVNVTIEGRGKFVSNITPAEPTGYETPITVHASNTRVDTDDDPDTSPSDDRTDCIGLCIPE
ncbi:MAG TPA: serine/threonine protein kinase [Candidatus Stackebrandtia excrementipullorum]|nr:serine/threonine protein kinase [Candidatus Stackebrandtia excrementipullorum]